MVSIPGVDYAWTHPGGAALAAAGKRFAARYLSADADKNLTRTEANDLAAHGVSSVVVWETTAKRPLAGRAAGISDAQTAIRQATATGMPPGRPIYFAVDFDAQPGQMATVMSYLDGAVSVLGRGRVGVYGGYATVRAALDGGHAAWAWQTRAWSAGRWDGRAVIRQGATQTIGGVSCDLNTALAADYGQWTPGHTPTEEDDMPTPQEIAAAIMTYQVDDPTKTGTQYITVKDLLWWTGANAAQANATITAQAAVIKVLAAKVGSGDDTATIVAAVQQAIEKAVVKVDVSVGDNTTQRG